MQETQEMLVLPLGREDPLEKEMATHSSIPAWKIPWPEQPSSLQSMGHEESDMTATGDARIYISTHIKNPCS